MPSSGLSWHQACSWRTFINVGKNACKVKINKHILQFILCAWVLCLHGCLHVVWPRKASNRDIGTEPVCAVKHLGAAALSVRTTFPNGPSGSWAVAPLCPPGSLATEVLLSRPFPPEARFPQPKVRGFGGDSRAFQEETEGNLPAVGFA